MNRFRTIIRLVAAAILGLLLHYVLPQHDVVQVTNTEIIRTDFSGLNRIFYAQADSGNADAPTRDLRLVYTNKQKTMLLGFIPRDDSEVMVYRNEDTGWIWPPYFKFDSSDLQAEVSNAARSETWAVITHYGWRIKWASVYPNAISIRDVEGPDVRIIPWFNIIFFGLMLFAFGMVRAMWRQFRERSVDPMLDNAGDQFDEFQAGVAEKRSGITKWLGTWSSKK